MKRVNIKSVEFSLLSENGSHSPESLLKNYNHKKLMYMKNVLPVSLCHKAILVFIVILSSLLFCSNGNAQCNKQILLPSVSNVGSENFISAYLYKNLNGVSTRLDGTVAVFDSSFSKEFGPQDARKMMNGSENISISLLSIDLSIIGLPLPVANDMINFKLNNLVTDSLYEIKFDISMLTAPGLTPFVIDHYLNTEVPAMNNVSFTPTNDVLTYENRFSLVFRPTSALPMKFTSVLLHKEGNYLAVIWKTAMESNMSTYEVEKSNNGVVFDKVAEFPAQNTDVAGYNFIDPQTVNGNNYFRIKAIQNDGKFYYSNVVVNYFAKSNTPLIVFPNPAKSTITLSYNILNSAATVSIYTMSGEKLTTYNVSVGSYITNLNVSNLTIGSYIVELSTPTEKNTSILLKL